MKKIEKISDITEMVEEGIDTAVSAKDHSIGIFKNSKKNKEYAKSEKFQKDLAVAQKIGEKADRLLKLEIILWLAMIIATIVLCITGNDIVLRILHI